MHYSYCNNNGNFMILKVACFKKAEAGAVDKEQQLGTASANLYKHMEKTIILRIGFELNL